jgi:hypothetical protein
MKSLVNCKVFCKPPLWAFFDHSLATHLHFDTPCRYDSHRTLHFTFGICYNLPCDLCPCLDWMLLKGKGLMLARQVLLPLKPQHQPPFCDEFSRDAQGCFWTSIFLIAAFWLARIIGVSHWCPVYKLVFLFAPFFIWERNHPRWHFSLHWLGYCYGPVLFQKWFTD